MNLDIRSLSADVSVAPKITKLCGSLSTSDSLETKFLQYHLIPCVLYLPAEKGLTPLPICYEKLTLDGGSTWHDGAAVDGKILLYFLLYLNHRQFSMKANADSAVANIEWLLDRTFLQPSRVDLPE